VRFQGGGTATQLLQSPLWLRAQKLGQTSRGCRVFALGLAPAPSPMLMDSSKARVQGPKRKFARREQALAGRCKSTCMNSMQTGIMPCATFRTVPFQQSSSHSFENYPTKTFMALVFSKAHSHAKCFSAKWQHDNGGAWLKL
jgi:hypothetical protein